MPPTIDDTLSKEPVMQLPICELCKKRNLTQEDIAEISGVPIEIVQDIEAGICDVGTADMKCVTKVLTTGIGHVARPIEVPTYRPAQNSGRTVKTATVTKMTTRPAVAAR
jgi:hypothetical protein